MKIRELRIDIDGISDIKGELEDISNKMSIFEKTERAEILNQFTEARKSIALIEKIEKHFDVVEQKYENIIKDLQQDGKVVFDEEPKDDNLKEIMSSAEHWMNVNHEIANLFEIKINELKNLSQQWKDNKSTLKAVTRYEEVQSEYFKLQEVLNKIGMKDSNDYPELVKRREHLDNKLKIAEKTKEEIDKLEIEKKRYIMK